VAQGQHLVADAHLHGRLQVVLLHGVEQRRRQLVERVAGEGFAQELQDDAQFAHADHGRHRRPLRITGLLAQRLLLGQDALGHAQLAEEFRRIEGFLDEIVAAGLIAKHARFVVVAGRNEDHRNVLRIPVILELPAQRVAVHHRHRDIEQEEVGFHIDQGTEAGLGGSEGVQLALRRQGRTQHIENDRVVIDDKNTQIIFHTHP
jgi:hypothetical protein